MGVLVPWWSTGLSEEPTMEPQRVKARPMQTEVPSAFLAYCVSLQGTGSGARSGIIIEAEPGSQPAAAHRRHM